MGNAGKTWLFFNRDPKGTAWDAILQYGPLPVGMVVSLQNTGDNPSLRYFTVTSTTLDCNRYSDAPDAEIFFTWLTRLDEI